MTENGKKKRMTIPRGTNPFNSKTEASWTTTLENKNARGNVWTNVKLARTLWDVAKRKEFEKITETAITSFVDRTWKGSNALQKKIGTAALVYFIVNLYNTTIEKTQNLYIRSKIIDTLKKVLLNLDSRTDCKWCVDICNEKNSEKLPRRAYDLFYYILRFEDNHGTYNIRESQSIKSLIKIMREMSSPLWYHPEEKAKARELTEKDLASLPETENKDDFKIGETYTGVINNIQGKMAFITFNNTDTIRWRVKVDDKKDLKQLAVKNMVKVKIEEKSEDKLFVVSFVSPEA